MLRNPIPALLLCAAVLLSGCASKPPPTYGYAYGFPYAVPAGKAANTAVTPEPHTAALPATPWGLSCRHDRFTDTTLCRLSLSLAQDLPVLVSGSLSSTDAGRRWDLVAAPPAVSLRLRVDQNPAIIGDCGAADGTCRVVGADAHALTEALRNGERLAVEVTTPSGGLDQDYQIAGFATALSVFTGKTGTAAEE